MAEYCKDCRRYNGDGKVCDSGKQVGKYDSSCRDYTE